MDLPLNGDEISFGHEEDGRRGSISDLDFSLESTPKHPHATDPAHHHHDDGGGGGGGYDPAVNGIHHHNLGCLKCLELEGRLQDAEKTRDKFKANLKKVKETMIDTGKLVTLYKDVERGLPVMVFSSFLFFFGFSPSLDFSLC